jgi:hypothetical protein
MARKRGMATPIAAGDRGSEFGVWGLGFGGSEFGVYSSPLAAR